MAYQAPGKGEGLRLTFHSIVHTPQYPDLILEGAKKGGDRKVQLREAPYANETAKLFYGNKKILPSQSCLRYGPMGMMISFMKS